MKVGVGVGVRVRVGVGVGVGMGMGVREAHWTCPYQFAMSILTHPTPFGAGLNLVHMRRSDCITG